MRVSENDAKNATTAAARLVHEYRPIALRQLSCNEQPEPGTAFTGSKERLEDPLGITCGDSRTAIGDLHERPFRHRHATTAHLDAGRCVRQMAVAAGVLAQVPHQLVQMRGIHADLGLDLRRVQLQHLCVNLQSLAKLGQEFCEPDIDLETFLAGRVAA